MPNRNCRYWICVIQAHWASRLGMPPDDDLRLLFGQCPKRVLPSNKKLLKNKMIRRLRTLARPGFRSPLPQFGICSHKTDRVRRQIKVEFTQLILMVEMCYNLQHALMFEAAEVLASGSFQQTVLGSAKHFKARKLCGQNFFLERKTTGRVSLLGGPALRKLKASRIWPIG